MTTSASIEPQMVQVPCGPNLSGVTEAPLSPITCWQFGTIPSVHVLPSIDVDQLKQAIEDISSLYPVIAGRLRKREQLSPTGKGLYYIEFTSSAIPLTLASTSSTEAFPTTAVIQPDLSTYTTPIDLPHQLNNPAVPLFTIKLTHLSNGQVVLGLMWAHILGDGSAFATFVETFSQLYSGEKKVEQIVKPTFGPHVDLIEEPTEEMLRKWELDYLYPTFKLPEAWGKFGAAAAQSEVVQVVFTADEVRLLKSLAKGAGEDEWVSEQDGLSSYWLNILRIIGEPVESAVHPINYRTHFPNSPLFPPNLPTLVANVAQMQRIALPAASFAEKLSLKPIALTIRAGLEALKKDDKVTREWISCRAKRMQDAIDVQEMQVLVPKEGDSMINSNWRYSWNHTFSHPVGTTSHHTSFSTINFLRVFRSNDVFGDKGESGAECTFNLKKGLKEKFETELKRDRKEEFVRWK
ncbi:hypothetical protein T439DRAFT_321506 [Meredithblackwellia eburnea MCA 4105]